jgi:hypothetical protein
MPITRVNIGNYTTTVFEGWVQNVQTSSTTNSIITSPFNYWIERHSTNITSTSNSTIYANWITSADISRTFTVQVEPEITPEQMEILRAEAEVRAKVREEAQRIQRMEKRRANRRALVLLLHTLVAEQRKELKEHGYFHVSGGATGTRYRIRKGRVANIDVLEGDKIKHRLCAHPGIWTPDYDTMAAQALHLGDAANEAAFVKVANIHPVRAA